MVKKHKRVQLGKPIELDMSRRYWQFNRQSAIKDVFDALVELITNSDDSYHRLFKAGLRDRDGGQILIECLEQRKGRPSLLRVRDRAEGMTLREMLSKLGTIGARRSEEGDRGFMARGARDCTELGEMLVQSIKGGRYYACKITPGAQIIPLKDGDVVDAKLRNELGVRKRENGTVVSLTIEPRHGMPRLDTFARDLPWHFALREILSEDSETQVAIRRLGDPDSGVEPLLYRAPEGEVVVDEDFSVAGYPDATAHLTLKRVPDPFETTAKRRFRRSGVLVKGTRAIHECSLLASEFEHDPLGACYFGKLECPYIDELLLEYDSRREKGVAHPEQNPILVIDPNRQTGLIRDHPFTRALFQIPTERLRALIAKDREAERERRSEIANSETKKRLDRLAKAAGRFMQQELEDFTEVAVGEDVDTAAFHEQGVMIVPTYVRLALGEEKTLWMYVSRRLVSSDSIEVTVTADSQALTILDSGFRLLRHPRRQERLVGTFRVRADALSDGVCIETNAEGVPSAEAIVEITERTFEHRSFEQLLEFEHAQYQVKHGGTRTLRLYALYPDLVSVETPVKVWSTADADVVVRGRCTLVPVAGSNYAQAQVVVGGRRLNAKVQIGAFVHGREACTAVRVIEKQRGGVPMKIEIRDEDYGNYRATWADHEGQPNLLLVSARHMSVKRYLGPGPEFQGQNSPIFRLLLAEIVAGSVCGKVLRLEAQEHPWQFRLAEVKDDGAIVNTVLSELQRRIRDFVAQAHAVMLSDTEIKDLA